MEIFLVGGAVRDKLIGFPWHERDWVVVGASPEQMEAKGFVAVGKDFPVFLHPKTKEEYALARTERKTAPGYTGFDFHTSPDVTLEEDLKRRDLTINAIAENESGELCDPYDGQGDIERRLLRHVSDAFAEDPVRILRVARFAARFKHLGFSIAEETLALMRAIVAKGEADYLVPERVWKEFSRALTEQDPAIFMASLDACQATACIMPELAEPNYLSDLVPACKQSEDPHIRFAALMCRLDEQAIRQYCERLTVPKDYRDLALCTASTLKHFDRKSLPDESSLLNILISLDAFRREERSLLCLSACEIIAKNSEMRALIERALQQCQAIDLKEIASSGFKGKAFGEELHQRRLQALRLLLSNTERNGQTL
jgi:tRNA nucleotidyltransferase (CCA-adding enzyme)